MAVDHARQHHVVDMSDISAYETDLLS
jgi:hypothetical protein